MDAALSLEELAKPAASCRCAADFLAIKRLEKCAAILSVAYQQGTCII
jgi:hypothetical protein